MSAAAIRLTRNSRFAMGGLRPWKVVIDGSVAGSIAHGEQIELPVDPGHHSLHLESSGPLRSPERSFEVGGGQVAGFSCRSRPFGALVVPSLPVALLKHDFWIILKRAG